MLLAMADTEMGRRRIRSPAGAEAGFALPLVLTMLLLVSLLAAAGHALSTLELRTSEAHRVAVQAFYLADGALQQQLGASRGAPDPATRFDFPEGSVAVAATPLLRLPGGEVLHRLLSRSALRGPADGVTRRGVGSVVVTAPDLRPPAALSLLGTLETVAGSARVDGGDGEATGCAPPGPVAGLAARAEALSHPPDEIRTEGDPPFLAFRDAAEAGAAWKLDWDAILGLYGPAADATVPPDPWPEAEMGGGAGPGFPVIRLRGPARLDAGHAGRGAIVADAGLELAAGFAWDGLVLVEGELLLSGPVRVRGAVAAGLGSLADRDPGALVLTGEGVDVRFHACHAADAAAALRLPPALRPGTWFEEMESWF